MKRLINPAPPGGVPYQNSDFNDILQYQSAWLPLSATYLNILESTVGTSSGLILNGINIVGTGSTTVVKFDNPFIYMNGEALSMSFSGTVSYQTNLDFYLYETPTTNESRILRNGTNEPVITNRSFTFSSTLPIVPKISFGIGNTYSGYESCLIENALNRFITPKGEMKLVNDISSFDNTGLGFGKYLSWAICNGQNGTPNLSGRVPVGLNLTDSDFNSIGVTGGSKTHLLTAAESGLPAHNHTIETTSPSGTSDGGIVGRGDGSGTETNLNTATISSAPASAAHNNLQPYYVAAWIIKL